MASIALGTALSTTLGASFGPLGMAAGYAVGSYIGGLADSRIFGQNKIKQKFFGSSKLNDLMVQTSAYGQTIPIIYGTNRFAGNVIWATPIQEHQDQLNHSTRVGKGGGKKISQTELRYTYTVNLAISLGLGPIDDITRIWADTMLLDLKQTDYRIYKGDNLQLPDPLIEAVCGIGRTPAYRGMAYIVLENFDLTRFGNRVPNFTFEIKKFSDLKNHGEAQLEELLTGMTIIPGCGEFVYDTEIQYTSSKISVNNKDFAKGKAQSINSNNLERIADSVLSTNQLLNNCPNLQWVSVVSSWFVNCLDINGCFIAPRIEHKDNLSLPNTWQVGNFTRKNTTIISRDKEGYPLFGGTPSDQSILNYFDFLKSNNLNIMFYPFLMVDKIGKPWRGHLSGNAEDVAHFFNKPDGYNQFILHYARLVKDKVDAFIIGSELIGLTKLRTTDNKFPAVTELIKLADQVRAIIGDKVKITYAADWSEYHHTEQGWYNLDDLWAHHNIDMIGIDAYFPLTENPLDAHDQNKIFKGWNSGEGSDFYYNGDNKEALEQRFAWKNMEHFWRNEHINPDGLKTSWSPKMKPIWITEFGFPSIDAASNKPNVFYDPDSIDGNIPTGSNGNIDFQAQRAGLTASLKFFKTQSMIEQCFAWCWDARPYPYFPDLKAKWRDAHLWAKGHWLNGKIGKASLAGVIIDLCKRVKISPEQIDVSKLTQTVEGLVISELSTVRQILDGLCICFNLESYNLNGKICFLPKTSYINNRIKVGEMIAKEQYPLVILRKESSNLPNIVNVHFVDKELDYQFNIARASNNNGSHHQHTIHLPIVTSQNHAQNIAEQILASFYISQTKFNFSLPRNYLDLALGDLIIIEDGNQEYIARINKLCFGTNGEIEVTALQDDPDLLNHSNDYLSSRNLELEAATLNPIGEISMVINENYQPNLLIAVRSQTENFKPVQVYNHNFELLTENHYEATMGFIASSLPEWSPYVIDNTTYLKVILNSGELAQTDNWQTAFINGELIAFKEVELVAEHEYIISKLKRNLNLATKLAHEVGNNFVLLDSKVNLLQLKNLELSDNDLKLAHTGQNLAIATNYTVDFNINNPLQVINITAIEQQNKLRLTWQAIKHYSNEIQDYKSADLEELKFLITITNMDDYQIFQQLINTNNLELPLVTPISSISKIIISAFHENLGYSKPTTLNIT
ncbi:glycoside hydrolase/phage tail family protein [Rickettsiales endosymbiont of Stachyamoeba lipophora]|uniref:glycoside hydrolase/phage tail family protein n=1 Tax=Rickettsiales endosymbiont of Stachyamoeba lipophora TaxID=2486578 RepID=UPI000F6480D0|nr:glycoside hydrolase TIM-barrel-like domain-containing protein [Rickettsiales endosymbiont of Stachyamoeba lipophora]AZL15537.1 hypothetical protein EF513_03090 [Rickettsiales endosymbiont of Stachyamoeba lipophora]